MRYQTSVIRLSLAILSLALISSPARSDYRDGVRDAAQGDYEGARREYFGAARDGNEKAQNNLARLYREGLGGPVDMERAFYWFSKAAQSGQVNAQTSLGDMFEKGDAVRVNYLAAAYWYRRAAISGFFIGQISLAEMLEAGRGIPQDSVAALAWYTIASNAKVNPANQYYVEESAKAAEARDSLARRLSKQQRAISQDLATRWLAGFDLPAPDRPSASDAPASADASSPPPQSATETVVATGTGFVINERGDVVTNNHVVAGCKRVTFELHGGRSVHGRLLTVDENDDIAVANFGVTMSQVASFSNRINSRPGDDLIVFGFPLLGVLSTSGNLTRGSLTAMSGLQDDSRYMQISAPVQPGNSGGPVLGMSGHVIGLVTYKLDALVTMKATGDIPQNVNFALKASVLRSFLDRRSIPYVISDASAVLGAAEVGDITAKFTGVVACIK